MMKFSIFTTGLVIKKNRLELEIRYIIVLASKTIYAQIKCLKLYTNSSSFRNFGVKIVRHICMYNKKVCKCKSKNNQKAATCESKIGEIED